uniref:GTP-binding protein 10 (putative) n=1 Tax=Mus musculus TaxID=10090 RepID=A0A0G2JF32_MOUSE
MVRCGCALLRKVRDGGLPSFGVFAALLLGCRSSVPVSWEKIVSQ